MKPSLTVNPIATIQLPMMTTLDAISYAYTPKMANHVTPAANFPEWDNWCVALPNLTQCYELLRSLCHEAISSVRDGPTKTVFSKYKADVTLE